MLQPQQVLEQNPESMNPANTRVGPMLGWCWANISPTLGQRFMFHGKAFDRNHERRVCFRAGHTNKLSVSTSSSAEYYDFVEVQSRFKLCYWTKWFVEFESISKLHVPTKQNRKWCPQYNYQICLPWYFIISLARFFIFSEETQKVIP